MIRIVVVAGVSVWRSGASGEDRREKRRQPIAHSPANDDIAELEWNLILRYVGGVCDRDHGLLAETAGRFDADDVNRRRVVAYIIGLLQLAIIESLGESPTIADFQQLASALLPAWRSITGQDLDRLVAVLTFSFGDDEPPDDLVSALGIIQQTIALALLRGSADSVRALRPQLARLISDNRDALRDLGPL